MKADRKPFSVKFLIFLYAYFLGTSIWALFSQPQDSSGIILNSLHILQSVLILVLIFKRVYRSWIAGALEIICGIFVSFFLNKTLLSAMSGILGEAKFSGLGFVMTGAIFFIYILLSLLWVLGRHYFSDRSRQNKPLLFGTAALIIFTSVFNFATRPDVDELTAKMAEAYPTQCEGSEISSGLSFYIGDMIMRPGYRPLGDYFVENAPFMKAEDIQQISVAGSAEEVTLQMKLTPEGMAKLVEETKENINRMLVITFRDQVISGLLIHSEFKEETLEFVVPGAKGMMASLCQTP